MTWQSNHEPTWQLNDNVATFVVSQLRGTIDLSRPEMGIAISELDRSTHRVLGATFPESSKVNLRESYVRGADLIALYPQTNARPFNVQLQYRLDETNGVVSIEQWISNYTFSLDTHPIVDVSLFDLGECMGIDYYCFDNDVLKQVEANSLQPETPVAAIVKTCHDDNSLVAMIHPCDQDDTTVFASDSSLNVKLFGQFMEKGVIRRARLKLCVYRRSRVHRPIAEMYQEFAASELPLTT
jgi:hypothetical protein